MKRPSTTRSSASGKPSAAKGANNAADTLSTKATKSGKATTKKTATAKTAEGKAKTATAKSVAKQGVTKQATIKHRGKKPSSTSSATHIVTHAAVITTTDLLPDGDYMNSQQQQFFRQRLETMRDELRNTSENTLHHLRDTSPVADPADRATIEEEQTFELRIRDRERKLLAKVEAALLRIEQGTYGFCEETGEPIGLQRLLARPTTSLTIEAQERREKRQRIYGE